MKILKRDDKRWITIDTFVERNTGEILGHVLPRGFAKIKIIKTEYDEDERYRYRKRSILVGYAGEQQQLIF